MQKFTAIFLLSICLPSAQYAQSENRNSAEYVSSSERTVLHPHRVQPQNLQESAHSFSCCQWTIPVIIDTSSPNLQAQTHAALAVDDSGNLVTAWMDTRSGGGNQIVVERSTNKGQTWLRSVPYSYAYLRVVRDIAFDHAGNLWLLWTSSTGEFQPFFLNLSKSTNSGQSFSTVFTSREYAGQFFESKLAIDRSNNVFILWPDQQFKLTRFAQGNISQRIDTEIPNDTLRVDFWCSLALDAKADVYCAWAGARTPGGPLAVFCSTSRDTGGSFTSSVNVDTAQLGQRYPTSVADSAGSLFVAYMRSPASVGRAGIAVARSLDSGFSFKSAISLIDSGHNIVPVACVDARNGLNVLWSGDGGAYFSRSTNAGQTFSAPQLIVAGRPDIGADHLGSLFAAFETALRIQFARTNVLVSVTEKQTLPSDIDLAQNYPNPFNPTTTISFALPSESHVSLKLYDLLGREVQSLVDESLTAGYHRVTLDGSSLATGVYLYRMTAGSFTSTKKLLLVK